MSRSGITGVLFHLVQLNCKRKLCGVKRLPAQRIDPAEAAKAAKILIGRRQQGSVLKRKSGKNGLSDHRPGILLLLLERLSQQIV